jgi:polyisoprenoid-binding protein YceI
MNKKALLVTGLCSAILFSFTLRQQDVSNTKQTEDITEAKHTAAAEKFMLDPKKCRVEWVGKGVGKQHNGTVDITTGSIFIDTKQITSIYAFMDMKTIKCADIKDAGFNKQLTDHLKSADFFNISKYPSATFKLKKATRLDVPEGQVNYTIVGDLAMHGITKSIEFPATVIFGKKKVTATAAVTIDRTEWEVKYNSGNYFKELGDKLIEDKMDLKLILEGNVQ